MFLTSDGCKAVNKTEDVHYCSHDLWKAGYLHQNGDGFNEFSQNFDYMYMYVITSGYVLVSFGYVISLFQANIRLVLSVLSLCRHLHTSLFQCNKQEEKAGLDKGRLSCSYQPCYNRAIKQREQLPSCKHPS